MSLIERVPARAPDATGEKVTLAVQLWPTLRVFEVQVFVDEKSPLALMPVKVKVCVPVFVIVTL